MRIRLSLLLLLVILGWTTQSGAAQPNRTFGIVEAYYRPDEAAQLGVAWERIVFGWDRFQPTPDTFNTEAMPAAIFDAAAASNREIVGLIKGTPAWASTSGTLAGVPVGLDLPYDDPNNTFASFVRQLVQTYSPRGVHNWIIWNEPDIRPGEGIVEFEGEVEDYYRLLKTAYEVIHAHDPQARVFVSGLTWWYDANAGREPYLRRLLNVIAADPEAPGKNWYFDGISLHIYFTTASVWDIIQWNRTILGEFRLDGKAVWLNEYNASPRRDPATPLTGAMFNISLEQQADYIVQASALALAGGVERMAVYRLYDDNFVNGQSEPWGLVRSDGSLRPGFYAYRQVIERMGSASSVQRYANEAATLITAAVPAGTLYILWTNDFQGGSFVIEGGFGAGEIIEVANAAGELTPVSAENGSLVIEALPAEQIDMPWVVVGGSTRLVTLPGAARGVVFRTTDGGTRRLR